jgi:hypothetical protein
VDENSNDDSDKSVEKNPPPIWAPITLAAIAYIGALLFKADWDPEYALYAYPRNPSMAIDAIGAIFPLFLGLIHLGISQFFKSKRNSRSRRRIMTGWSLVSIVVLLIAFVGFTRHS